MSVKSCNITRMSSSPRLIPKWKDLEFLINNILQDIKVDGRRKNDTVVLSDWPETLYQEPHHPRNKPFICFYSINVNYFVSLNWMEPYSKQSQAILWIQKKNTEMEGMIEKIKFHITDQLPPIQAMVHTDSHRMLIAYCGDMRLRLFRDHHQAFAYLGTVPCRFSVSCLCYHSRTEILLSGTLGAVVTWFILPNGRGLQMAQTVPMLGHELVQGFSLNGPQGSLLALCENKVRVFTDQGQGQLKEVKNFTPIASGSSITCSFACVSQGYFYAGNRDGEIHAWGLDRGNFLHSFQAHSSSVICVHSRPETHTLLTAGSEGVVREWNLAFGNLLRQLNIDEDLQQLQFIDNNTFFCQTTNTFLLYNLPCFYSLFNVCGSALQQVQRVCCGRNWTRIVCATKDGLVRFLSPVTGELLVITWPLLVTDKALVWAYDSDREELFVATDSSEVLVFDATRSPCTAKYLVCTSVTRGDRVRCLTYAQSHLRKGLVGLMFCGHESGIVRILSYYSCARIEKTVHSGAVLALSTLEGPQKKPLLCSYGMDNTIQLTESVLQENKVILQPVSKILCSCPLKHVILLPGSVGAITENHCWCLWHYEDFVTSSESKQSSMSKETKCLHQCAITSFDVCLSLKLFVTGGIDGSVRIWDFHGRLITKLDSALHFGPLCFANNRGDLLLAFNQSLYLVSCLKLLPPAQLIHLAVLNNADEIQEVPKPFLPSFFFSFEVVFIPKFVYLGQGLQELQGLEALVNKRAIAFDNTVPHVVEEERHMSSVIQKEPKVHFLEDKDVDFSTLHSKQNRPPFSVPAQLRLAGWDGLNPYHILRCFFGKGRQWPFAPDGYIPNSVVRARLWPEGTPIFLLCDLYPPYRNKDWDRIELFRCQAWSPMTLVKEKISSSKQDKSKKRKQSLFDVLVSMPNLNWIGRKFDEGLINNFIETTLNHTIYCSVEQYETYTSILAQIFATYQVSSSLYSETACRLLEDTTHPNPRIRELAWEGLERLGFMSPLFAIPLAMGLMDSNENVRAKALQLMIRATGIQTKTMLVNLLKKRETFQDMQQEFIGETSLDQLLGIQARDIRYLLSQVEQQLNENLMLSRRDQQFTFSPDMSKAGELEALAEQTLTLLSKPEKLTTLKKRMAYVQSKSRNLIEKDLKVSRKQKQTELVKSSSVLVPSKDEGEQTEAMRPEQIDNQDAAIEPELPLRAFSPVKSQEDAESKEITLDIMEAMGAIEVMEATEATGVREAMEAAVVVEAMDQPRVKDYEEMTPKLERQKHMKRLWKRAMKKSRDKADVKLKEKKDLKGISEITAEEPKEEVIEITVQENDTEKKLEKSGRGLAGTPGRIGRSDTRCWRDDICSLATSRIASSHPGMVRDLSQELVDLAQAVLAPRQPSWNIFQEICPLLKSSSELHHKVVEEQPIITEKVVEEVVKEEGTIEPREQGGKKVVKKGKAFSQVKKKKIAFLKDHLVLEKSKFEKEVRKLDRQDGKIAEEEKKLSKPEKKFMQEKEKFTKDKEKLTHEKEKIALEEETLASSQKKLTREEQKLVLGEKKQTGKIGKLLGARKNVTWKKGEATPGRKKWDWEENVLAQEEGVWTQEERLLIWEERKLSQEEEKADEGEEEPSVYKKLGEEEKPGEEGEEELIKGEEELDEEEKPGEEEEEELIKGEEELDEEEKPGEEEEEEPIKGEEELDEEEKPGEEEEEELIKGEEELGEEEKQGAGEGEEELAWNEEQLILYLEKQAEERQKKHHKKKKHILGVKKHVKEEAWKKGKLAQKEEHLFSKEEGLSGELGEWTLRKESLEEQEIPLTQEKKEWFVKEIKEAHKKKQIQEKEKQIEKQEKDQQERKAKKDEKEAKDKKLVWKRKKLGLGEEKFEELSQEDKQTQKKEKRAWEKERRAQEEEETVKQRQQAWGKKKVDLREEEQAREMEKWSQKEKKQVQAKHRQDQKEEKLGGKVEKEAVEKTLQDTEKVKPVPGEEKMMKETGKVSPEEEKQVMKKEKEAKIKEKWIGKDKKTTEKKKQWSLEKGQAQKERIWGQIKEKDSEKKEEWTWEKEKLSLEEEEQVDEKEKKSQEEEERELEKRLTKKDSKLAKEERHISKKEKEKPREGTGITKRKKEITQEEKKLMKKEAKLSQEERQLTYDRTKETGVAKRKKERTKEERTEATRKLVMERKVSSAGKEASFKGKDLRKNESHLLRLLAKTIREISTVPLGEIKIPEEERSSIVGRSEIDGQRWESLREQEEITKEEKELDQKERTVEGNRLPTKERTLTDEDSLEEDRKLLNRAQETVSLDKIQVESILKEIQKQNILGKRQLKKLQKKIKNKPEKIPVKWLLGIIKDILFEGLSESLTEKEIEEAPTEKGKEEESLSKEEEGSLSERKEEEEETLEEGKESLSERKEEEKETLEEGKESLSERKEEEEETLEEGKESVIKEEKESLEEEEEKEEEEESLEEEEEENLEEEEENLEEEEENLEEEEEEEESLEEEEENLEEEEEEKESLEEEEEEESLEEEEEESLEEEEEEEESLEEEEEEEESLEEEEEEEESLEEEEEESLEEEKESLSEEESSSEKEEEEIEKVEKKEEEGEEKKERQKDEGSLSQEKQEESMLSQEERVLKTELSKEGVSFSQLVKEGVILAEEREGTARSEVPFKKERLLDGKRDPTFMDKPIWPTDLKSPFKIPLPVALGKKEGMPPQILGDRLDLEKQESQLGTYPTTSSWRKQENVLLEKSRGVFLPAVEIGLETQIPEGLHRPGFPLPDLTMKPQKPKRRSKGGKWEWFLKYWDSSEGKTEGQGPAPAPALSFLSMPAKRPGYLEAGFSDEDWVNNALIRLKSGEKLTRDNFHRLSQLLRDFTSKEYLKRMNLSDLKAIVKHFRQILEVSNTDRPRPYKDVLSPLHLKAIPPARGKEKESCLEPFPICEAVLPSATRTQTPQALKWHLLAEPYRKKQAQQLSTAAKRIKHIYPIRRDKKSLALIFQEDFWASRERDELPKFHKAKKKLLPIPAPALPPTTKMIRVPTTIDWHLLGEPYRSVRVQQLSSALKEMEMRHFFPAPREIFTGAHASVDKQTLALMFQKDLRAFKGKGRLPKLPQLEKKAKPDPKEKEEVPLWETFVALYHVLQMLQERYADDSAAWMEQFYQLMDLYQVKSPGIQRLLLELLQRKELQPQETIYKKSLKTKELALGERLLCGLFCGSSHAPAGPIKFQDVVPLSGQNKVHSFQPVGIAHYGFLELAWKNLPQCNPYLTRKLPTIHTPNL